MNATVVVTTVRLGSVESVVWGCECYRDCYTGDSVESVVWGCECYSRTGWSCECYSRTTAGVESSVCECYSRTTVLTVASVEVVNATVGLVPVWSQ